LIGKPARIDRLPMYAGERVAESVIWFYVPWVKSAGEPRDGI
jgi:hypothetical protein